MLAVGGGPAGVAAAIVAARNCADTTLFRRQVRRNQNAGDQATQQHNRLEGEAAAGRIFMPPTCTRWEAVDMSDMNHMQR